MIATADRKRIVPTRLATTLVLIPTKAVDVEIFSLD
jgi:hypothetical protein